MTETAQSHETELISQIDKRLLQLCKSFDVYASSTKFEDAIKNLFTYFGIQNPRQINDNDFNVDSTRMKWKNQYSILTSYSYGWDDTKKSYDIYEPMADIEVKGDNGAYANFNLTRSKEGPILIEVGACSVPAGNTDTLETFFKEVTNTIGQRYDLRSGTNIGLNVSSPEDKICFYWNGKIHRINRENVPDWLKTADKQLSIWKIKKSIFQMFNKRPIHDESGIVMPPLPPNFEKEETKE